MNTINLQSEEYMYIKNYMNIEEGYREFKNPFQLQLNIFTS